MSKLSYSSNASATQSSAAVTPQGQVLTSAALANIGRLCGPVTGVTGVAPNGNMTVNIPATGRYHWIKLFCNGGTAVAANQTYTLGGGVVTGTRGQTYASTGVLIIGGLGLVSVAVTTAATAAADGSYTLWSAAGDGSAVIVTVKSGQIVQAVIGAQGGGGWINPSIFFLGPIHVLVGTVEVRGWQASEIIAREAACGNIMQAGELTFFFTEPRQRFGKRNTQCSWAMQNQTSFQIQATINGNVVAPTVLASAAWDYLPNQIMDNASGATAPSYNIIAHRRITTPPLSAGSLVAIPAGTIRIDQPIRRMWFLGATPGLISQIFIKSDNNVWEQRYALDINGELAEFGFAMTPPYGSNNVMSPGGNIPTPFDTAFVTDPDEVIAKSITTGDLEVMITQTASQSITILLEQLENGYK